MQVAGTTEEDRRTELALVRLAGGDALQLCRSGGRYEIRFNGRELMSDRAHWSETALGALACEGIRAAEPCVLIGGLGMGYTLRAALDVLPGSARVLVAELLPEVIAWNRGPLAHLNGCALDDRRVVVEPGDVATVLGRSPGQFDAVVLDVDNGPDDVTFAGNRGLYDRDGLMLIRRALRPRGMLGVWASRPSRRFEERAAHCGFALDMAEIAARGCATDPRHTIYLATGKRQ